MANKPKSGARTTETSIQIIDVLRELGEATIHELSEHLGLAPSTVHRHLVTLREHSYVVCTDGRYRIGFQFLTVGGHAQRTTTAYPMIKQKVDVLAAETGERSQFIVEEHGERVYLYTEVGQSAVQTGAHIGKRGPLHTSAAGKAILANMPADRVDEIVATHGLQGVSENTITTRAELEEECERIRERGYAFNRQETTEGVHAVGAAVTDADDEVIGALSVSGPAHRVKGAQLTDELPERVLGAVNELELHIAHSI
ncbi:transcriptional regulator, IclR family protein [Natronococcus amylolyticus DSM 10524]|uniref:Transcriptional regulator, IclR family protein n=1 Tax=Natronococcus amylolyticus DSM 10524 TaxID=1227497 RepID=L9X3W0_9EURY|nr:IclR family transcriptional regulator [Natronococcus amylolyticus]ELY56146.1 transcriptional regulator, IclR family protein [Natronococcus amylolyticus DSM 10524]